MTSTSFELVWPSMPCLPGYADALRRGWSPDNLRGEAAAREELERIARDPEGFVASLVDRQARGAPIVTADGTTVPRLPGYHLWMWDGEFCGDIGVRWQLGTETLPPTCLGHIGYTVVPWKRRRGYATRAVALILPEVAKEHLRYVEITTTPENMASQRVIEANGGVLLEEFISVPALGSRRQLRYRIPLESAG
jgi:predicted acetyltransferase